MLNKLLSMLRYSSYTKDWHYDPYFTFGNPGSVSKHLCSNHDVTAFLYKLSDKDIRAIIDDFDYFVKDARSLTEFQRRVASRGMLSITPGFVGKFLQLSWDSYALLVSDGIYDCEGIDQVLNAPSERYYSNLQYRLSLCPTQEWKDFVKLSYMCNMFGRYKNFRTLFKQQSPLITKFLKCKTNPFSMIQVGCPAAPTDARVVYIDSGNGVTGKFTICDDFISIHTADAGDYWISLPSDAKALLAVMASDVLLMVTQHYTISYFYSAKKFRKFLQAPIATKDVGELDISICEHFGVSTDILIEGE